MPSRAAEAVTYALSIAVWLAKAHAWTVRASARVLAEVAQHFASVHWALKFSRQARVGLGCSGSLVIV